MKFLGKLRVTDSNCLPVGKVTENGAFGGLFSASFPHPCSGRLSRRPWLHDPQFCRASSPVLKTAAHLSFCSLKAQTGYLGNLVVSRILFKGRVRPLSVEDGSPQLSQFYPARRLVALAPKLSTDQNLSSGCSVH